MILDFTFGLYLSWGLKDNNMGLVNPKQYTRVFGGPGMPYITSYMFAYHYRTIDFLITWKDNMWTAFLKKDMLEKTLNDGVRFYSDRKKFLLFLNEYKKHFSDSISFFEKISKKKIIKKNEIKTFFNHAGKTLSLYVKCEFFYLDRAFRVAKKNSVLKRNLDDFNKLKKPGKEQIIRVYFDANSYVYRVLRILSKQFSVDFEDLVVYDPDEVIGLFDGGVVNKQTLNKRRDFYILKGEKGKVILLQDDIYKNIIDVMVPKIKSKKVLKGTIANKGKVIGKVKLFNHGYEFYKVKKLTQEMSKGDILVTETTSPELMVACQKAGAIVTNEGGLLSHAAIVSRELGIPCIVGALGVTSSLKNGDKVEVDANKGVVRKIR